MILLTAVARHPYPPTTSAASRALGMATALRSFISCGCFRRLAAGEATRVPPHDDLRRLLSISRMLDLGRAPSGWTDSSTVARTVNASKNCRLQAICFDFETLTQSLDHRPASGTSSASSPSGSAGTMNLSQQSSSSQQIGRVLPDASKIEQIAGLLKVKLGSEEGSARRTKLPDNADDLSLLTGDAAPAVPSWSRNDIRAKYAAKLSKKGVPSVGAAGSVDGTTVEATLQRGDAAVHLAARQWAAAASPSSASQQADGTTRWMARSGTGFLLQYATQRSIRLAALPSHPGSVQPDEAEAQKMEALQRQLPEVVWNALLTDGTKPASELLAQALECLQQPPAAAALLVSRRDEYLRAAREAGWMTCRIRPKNAPRGNVSSHFTVESVPEVRQVLDEINGISYAAVLNQGASRR